MPAEQEAGMHVLILTAPAGVFTFGPFGTRQAVVDFFGAEGLSELDPDQHTATVNRVSPPFDLTTDPTAHLLGAGPALCHQSLDADDRADGYLIVLRDGGIATSVGAFTTRQEAQTWWNTQRGYFLPPLAATATPLLAKTSADGND